MTNAEARFNKSLRPRKPEGSLGRTAQDVHLDSHTAPELCVPALADFQFYSGVLSPRTPPDVGLCVLQPSKTRTRRMVVCQFGWLTVWILLSVFVCVSLTLSLSVCLSLFVIVVVICLFLSFSHLSPYAFRFFLIYFIFYCNFFLFSHFFSTCLSLDWLTGRKTPSYLLTGLLFLFFLFFLCAFFCFCF